MTKEETPLKARVQELQRKLAEVRLRRCKERSKIKELEAKAAESVPEAELEPAKARTL